MLRRREPRQSGTRRPVRRPGRRTLRPSLEPLEGRALLATSGYDYILTGLEWPNPGHITYSYAPDGVLWDHGVNNLNATFNAAFGTAWRAQIARALATWQSVANIEISPRGEVGNADFNVVGPGQGDSRFGDIRFGGYNFNNPNMLAQTYSPPPAGYTGSGDVAINTSMSYHIGSNWDLFSVMLHETGLSLGLAEPPNSSVVMNTVYGGVRRGLTAGDIAGIQAIYGARVPDGFQSHGQGLASTNAINVTPILNANAQATIANASLSTIGDTEYFTVVAPAGSGQALQVSAVASGVSMLSPKITLLDASGNVLGTAAKPSAWADTVSTSFGSVTPGQKFIIAVTGATSDVFAVGAYHLQVSFPNAVPAHPSGGTGTTSGTGSSTAPTPVPVHVPVPKPVPKPTPSGPTTVPHPTAPTYLQRLQAWWRSRQALRRWLHPTTVHRPLPRAQVADRVRH